MRQTLEIFGPRYTAARNPLLASPLLLAALWRLRPGPEPRQIGELIKIGRVAAAASLVEQILADADHL
jgi:hypothetical protein